MMQKMEPTDEQRRIIDEDGNLVVIARPGSGKTYTIVKKIEKIVSNCFDFQGVIAISYTKKASRELEQRCLKAGISKKSSFFGTIDHFYISEIIMPFAKHLFNRIIDLQVEDSLNSFPEYASLIEIKKGISEETEKLLKAALEAGHIFLEISGETALYILNNVKEARQYIQARYTHIFIDEYQDCGEIQHLIFMRLIELGLKGIAVGDVDQAIYAFAERYSKFLQSLTENESFKSYRINKNHRCHESIEAYSLQLLGIRQSKPDQDNIRVFQINCEGNEEQLAKKIAEKIDSIKEKYSVGRNSDIGILCRYNSSAKLLSDNLKMPNKLFAENDLDTSHYQWSRFFADLLRDYFDTNVFAIDVAERYADEKFDRKIFKKLMGLIQTLFEQEPMKLQNYIGVFEQIAWLVYPEYKNGRSKDELKHVLQSEDSLEGYRPAADEEICIMTLHKSKGLEFDVVFHMDLYDWIFPQRNISDEEYTQELNLHYVGITRAKKACYLMQGTQRHRKKQNDFYKAEPSPFLFLNSLPDYRIHAAW